MTLKTLETLLAYEQQINFKLMKLTVQNRKVETLIWVTIGGSVLSVIGVMKFM